MKAKEELSALRKEVEALNKKLRELTADELAQLPGGIERKPIPDYLSPDIEWNLPDNF